jgi:hypothetical protein
MNAALEENMLESKQYLGHQRDSDAMSVLHLIDLRPMRHTDNTAAARSEPVEISTELVASTNSIGRICASSIVVCDGIYSACICRHPFDSVNTVLLLPKDCYSVKRNLS